MGLIPASGLAILNVLMNGATEGWRSLIHLTIAASPEGKCWQIYWFMLFFLYILNAITGNWSHMDRWWSVAPAIFCWICWWQVPTTRLLIMSILVTAWGLRLTFNFWRKGGYSSIVAAEDYRWEIIRNWPAFKNSVIVTQIFSFFFVSGAQSIVDFAIAFPALIAANPLYSSVPLGYLDIAAAVLMACLLTLETVADEQHWNYQEPKWAAIKAKKPLTPEQEQGFCSTGLRKYSRHPNYFGEIGQWYSFYIFSVACTGLPFNPLVIGPIALHWMVSEATTMIEEISQSKYPRYAEYRKTVSRMLPMPSNWKINNKKTK